MRQWRSSSRLPSASACRAGRSWVVDPQHDGLRHAGGKAPEQSCRDGGVDRLRKPVRILTSRRRGTISWRKGGFRHAALRCLANRSAAPLLHGSQRAKIPDCWFWLRSSLPCPIWRQKYILSSPCACFLVSITISLYSNVYFITSSKI